MCFSAEASFTAAAALTVAGGGGLYCVKRRALIPMALVPLLFALQQFSEGVIWSTMGSSATPFWIREAAKYGFLFFAFLVWPVWIPFAFRFAESTAWKKRAMGVILACGSALALYFFLAVYDKGVGVKVLGRSLEYFAGVPFEVNPYILNGIYTAVIVLPCFLSSLKFAKLFGFLVIAAWFMAMAFYMITFISVWCFFSALVSVVLLPVICKN